MATPSTSGMDLDPQEAHGSNDQATTTLPISSGSILPTAGDVRAPIRKRKLDIGIVHVLLVFVVYFYRALVHMIAVCGHHSVCTYKFYF